MPLASPFPHVCLTWPLSSVSIQCLMVTPLPARTRSCSSVQAEGRDRAQMPSPEPWDPYPAPSRPRAPEWAHLGWMRTVRVPLCHPASRSNPFSSRCPGWAGWT